MAQLGFSQSSCPTPMENLNTTAYAGTWYMVATTDISVDRLACPSQDYIRDNNFFQVSNTDYTGYSVNYQCNSTNANIYVFSRNPSISVSTEPLSSALLEATALAGSIVPIRNFLFFSTTCALP